MDDIAAVSGSKRVAVKVKTATQKKQEENTIIAKRLTPYLAKQSWSAVPVMLLEKYRDMGLSAHEAMFLIYLLSFKWDERNPFPGLRGIAATMQVDYSTVRRYAKKCRDFGLIKMQHRRGRTCVYSFEGLFTQLEDFAKKKDIAKLKRNRMDAEA